MDRTVALATTLLMVVITVSAGVVSPAAGGTSPVASDHTPPDADSPLTVSRTSSPLTVSRTSSPLTVSRAMETTSQVGPLLPPEPVENSTARLVIPEEDLERSGMTTVQPDLAAALTDAGDDLDRRHDQLVAEVRIDAATSDDEKDLVVDQTLIDLKNDAVELRERQQVAISSYANGTIDGPELLRTLARIDRSARRMLETTSYLEDVVDRVGLSNRIREVEAILEILKGPVRKEVRRTLTAGGGPSHFYVEATDTALVISTVDDGGTFLREAYIPGNRGEGPSRSIDGPLEAAEYSNEYYPWAWDNFVGTSGARKLDDVFLTKRPHVQGEIVAYLDAYSGDVFYEIQYLDVDAIEMETVRNVTRDGLRIVVERTYPGGPMRIGVYDAETGNNVNARVSVAGVDVGSTDADSLVRAVEPRTEYEIEVRTSLTTTNVTVDPQGED